jgi:2-dehydro-3-deoxyphosphogluconate aldolase / (4S)-4-hydroxy-2-oxoglutarate aldolase
MARFDRLTVYNTLVTAGALPLFYHGDIEVVKQVTAALVVGGCTALEFTNRGDFAFQVFGDLIPQAASAHPDLIIGVGSVEDAPTAALYIARGANFIVGPNFNPEIARLCNRRKIAYIPGCGSVTEIAEAEELGAEIVKLFPADALNGPTFIKAVLGPRPWTRIMPTGGVSPDEANLREWFEAGAVCVGMGSKLVRSDWVKSGDYSSITNLAYITLERIRLIRGEKQ